VDALILLLLIGVLGAFAFTRVRKRMNLNVNSKHWIYAILVVVIGALILWANAHAGHTGHH
jgi:uncharacterized membrane protein YeaQ/YmgE (transglycosylase-associated protein family)